MECHIYQDLQPHLLRDAQVNVHVIGVIGNGPDIGKEKVNSYPIYEEIKNNLLLARISVSCW